MLTSRGATLMPHFEVKHERTQRKVNRRLLVQSMLGCCHVSSGRPPYQSGAGARVRGLDDVARQGLRLVNREAGAQARTLLDRECARLHLTPADLDGYDSRAAGHLQVAAAIVGGLADAGVSSEPAALAYGLDFLPLASQRCARAGRA